MYDSYQTMANAGDRVRLLASAAGQFVNSGTMTAWTNPLRPMTALLELIALAGFTHDRPDYEIADVEVRGKRIRVEQGATFYTPFCKLVRFSKLGAVGEPNVLLAAPMSGHFATLLRGTIRTLLKDHVVYVTDWINPRNIPLSAGRFGLDEYTQHLIDFIRHIGPQTHVVAVCQPAVSALAATAVMAQEGANGQPASLTLMAGPIDTRVSPTKVNELANDKPIEWFSDNLIGTVPKSLEGAGRRVYPGFIQLSAFMSMNAERHAKSFADLFKCRLGGDDSKADAISEFYKEYFAVMDLSAEFFLETVAQIFQQYALPLGAMKFKGMRIEPRAIRKTFLRRSRRKGRHLRGRSDAGGAGSLFGAAALYEKPPYAGRRRPLWRLQRPPLGKSDLPGRAKSYPVEPLTDASLAAGCGNKPRKLNLVGVEASPKQASTLLHITFFVT